MDLIRFTSAGKRKKTWSTPPTVGRYIIIKRIIFILARCARRDYYNSDDDRDGNLGLSIYIQTSRRGDEGQYENLKEKNPFLLHPLHYIISVHLLYPFEIV